MTQPHVPEPTRPQDDDMAAFLHARLNDDEQLTRQVEATVGAHRCGEPYENGSGTASFDAYPSYPWHLESVELRYMSRWHPRQVIADVAARRRIAELHAECHDCPTMRLLVLSYASHPDYRAEWAP